MTPIRVVLVDDQQLIRVGFRRILETESDIEVVGEAANGVEALEVVRWRRPDVVLMDIQMPVMDGLEATRRLLDVAASRPRVIILTTFELDEYVFEALRAGASGFLVKNAPPEDLVAAIRSVMAGGALLSPGVTARVIAAFVHRRASDRDTRRLDPHRARARGARPDRARPVEPRDRRPRSSSARRPSRPTSRTSLPSSRSATGSAPSSSPTSRG